MILNPYQILQIIYPILKKIPKKQFGGYPRNLNIKKTVAHIDATVFL